MFNPSLFLHLFFLVLFFLFHINALLLILVEIVGRKQTEKREPKLISFNLPFLLTILFRKDTCPLCTLLLCYQLEIIAKIYSTMCTTGIIVISFNTFSYKRVEILTLSSLCSFHFNPLSIKKGKKYIEPSFVVGYLCYLCSL